MPVTITILKTNGQRAVYRQSTATLARATVKKLVPRSLFSRGPIVLGTGNPFTVLNPAHVACIEVESDLVLPAHHAPGIESANLVTDRDSFLKRLDQRWANWRKRRVSGEGQPYEALIHLELAGGWDRHVHVIGKLPDKKTDSITIESMFSTPVLCVRPASPGMHYINPVSIVRMRVYHSNADPVNPPRTLPVDPDDV